MTYPTEFFDQAKTVGKSGLKHPYYTFSVNLDLYTTEVVGSGGNMKTITVLHPDQHQSSPDLGRTQRAVRDLQRTTWFPGMLAAGNIEINDDGTITAYGQQAKYLLDTYTTGANPLLTLTNSAPYVG